MRITEREEVTIEFSESEKEKAAKLADAYKAKGYTVFNESDEFIQLDTLDIKEGG